MSNTICRQCVHNYENECEMYGDIHVDDAVNFCDFKPDAPHMISQSDSIAAEIDRLKTDDKCIRAILYIDSPDGTICGTSNLVRSIADFGKPIEVNFDGCASIGFILSMCNSKPR